MKTLQECLTGYYPGFHGKKHLYELMTKHKGFHAGSEIWFVRDAWAAGQFLIFQVRFGPETSSMPQSPDNEVGEVISFIDLNLNSFISAVVCTTNDNTNYDKVLELFVPEAAELYKNNHE